MKKLYRLVAFLLLAPWACLAQGPPTNMPNTVVATFLGAPTGACSPTMIATRTDTGAFYDCFGGGWRAASSGAATVTSVTGTTNQISIASGTTAPVMSLPSAITLPSTLALASGTNDETVVTSTSGQLATSPVSIDASVQAGADWSVKVNAAFTALGSNFGTVDARGFTGTQAMSVSVTVPPNDVLLLPCMSILRATGIQLIVSSGATVKGCGMGGITSGGGRYANTQIYSQNTDTSPVVVQTPTNIGVAGIVISDLGLSSTASGGVALQLVDPLSSTFSRLMLIGDTAAIIGGLSGGCACYNSFYDTDFRGVTAGLHLDNLGSPDSNQFYGGQMWASTGTAAYIGRGAGGNQFYAVDVEQNGRATASFDIAGASNVIYTGYMEGAGPIIFESGAYQNWVYGPNTASVVSDLSGNTTNIVNTWLQVPNYLTAHNGFIFGTRNDGPTNESGISTSSWEALLSNGYTGGTVDLSFIGNSVNVGYYGHGPLRVGGFKSYSGQTDTGKVTITALATPSAPTVVVTGGTGTKYTYYVVCRDYSGGVTLPSSGTTVSGRATLSASAYNTITPPSQEGCFKWDILSGNTSRSLFLNTVCSTAIPCKDTGQSTNPYSVPARNTTGDESIAGNLTVTGHNTLEGVPSTGATGTGKIVFDTSPTLTTPVLGAATATALLATGMVDGTVPAAPTTQTACTLGTASPGCLGSYNTGYSFNEYATAGTGVTYTLPTAAAGKQYCVANAYNGTAANTGALTLQTSASGQYIIFTDGTLTARGGHVVSSGAAADSACVVGVDSTHWFLYVRSGTWAKH